MKLVHRNISFIQAEMCGNYFNFRTKTFSKETCLYLDQRDPWGSNDTFNSVFSKGLLIAICNIRTLNVVPFVWSVLPKWSWEVDEVFFENNFVTISINL